MYSFSSILYVYCDYFTNMFIIIQVGMHSVVATKVGKDTEKRTEKKKGTYKSKGKIYDRDT